jgi:hypothetical protein
MERHEFKEGDHLVCRVNKLGTATRRVIVLSDDPWRKRDTATWELDNGLTVRGIPAGSGHGVLVAHARRTTGSIEGKEAYVVPLTLLERHWTKEDSRGTGKPLQRGATPEQVAETQRVNKARQDQAKHLAARLGITITTNENGNGVVDLDELQAAIDRQLPAVDPVPERAEA